MSRAQIDQVLVIIRYAAHSVLFAMILIAILSQSGWTTTA